METRPERRPLGAPAGRRASSGSGRAARPPTWSATCRGLGLSSSGERGLLGIAFDPDYADQQVRLPLLHQHRRPNPHNRISRFTVNDANAADYSFVDTDAGDAGAADEVDDPRPRRRCRGATNHNGGAIHFGPDGKLYVAVGDNATGANAQTLANRHGKMLRINADGTIPTDNPFFAGIRPRPGRTGPSGRRACATRSRSRSSPAPGGCSSTTSARTPGRRSTTAAPGANYGWPTTEGDFNPGVSSRTSPAPLYAYSHGGGHVPGVRHHRRGVLQPGHRSQFPAAYAGDYFFADFVNDWINVIDADGDRRRRAVRHRGPGRRSTCG